MAKKGRSKNESKDEWIQFDITQQTAFSEQERVKKLESMKQKMDAQEPESAKVMMKKLDDENCSDFSATAKRFLLSHPDVMAASGTAQRGTAPGREMMAYFNDHHLDKCSDASWIQAYEALQPTGAFRLK